MTQRPNNRKQQMFQHQDVVVAPVTNGNGNSFVGEIKAQEAEYHKWIENCTKTSLAEVLAKAGVVEAPSPQGFAALNINPTAKNVNFVKSSHLWAAMNAALGWGKYRVLDYADKNNNSVHIAYFDPTVDCEAVKSVFRRFKDAEGNWTGEWQFFDWKDQSFQVSVLDWDNSIKSYDGDGLVAEKQRRIAKRANMVRKHHVINQMLSSQALGSRFLAVMNNQEDLARYNLVIKDHLEESYDKALAAEDDRWAEAREAKVAKNGYAKPTNTAVQEKHTPEHKDLLGKIVAEQGLVTVRILFSGRTAPWERTFDPSVDETQVNALKSLPLTAKIVGYEKVE